MSANGCFVFLHSAAMNMQLVQGATPAFTLDSWDKPPTPSEGETATETGLFEFPNSQLASDGEPIIFLTFPDVYMAT